MSILMGSRLTPARYMPSAAERALIRLNALQASMRARERGIVDPVKEEKHAAWRRGDLRWKMDRMQVVLYDFFKGLTQKQGVVEGARKLGKTFAFGSIALETAQQNPGKQINWTKGSIIASEKDFVPILEEISADAPPDCKGEYDWGLHRWVVPNGAYIQIFSCETMKECEKGRGPSSILNIIDEAGFIDLVTYLVDSVFSPQLRRVKRAVGSFVGLTLLCSTTPYTPVHPFCAIADAAAATSSYAKRTIYDSGFESPAEIEQYIADEAAKKNMSVEAFKATSTFKREFMSERVVDADKVVFPEFSQELVLDGWPVLSAKGLPLTIADHVVREWQRPIGFHQFIYKRTAGDPGGTRDPTGILAGYVDFTHAKVVVEGERLLPRPNTKDIFDAVVELETELWGPAPDPPAGQPYLDRSRITRAFDDPTGRVTLDLWELHKLHCAPAVKNDRNASIGLIRTMAVAGTLVINPRCVKLMHQLKTSLSNKERTDFERNSEGHCDLAATLMYFVRDLSLTTNPYPSDFESLTGRAMPPQHPIAARRSVMGKPQEVQGLAGQILGGNAFVQAQLRRKLR